MDGNKRGGKGVRKSYFDVSFVVSHFDKDDNFIGHVDVEVCFEEDLSSALALVKAVVEPYSIVTISYRYE